jgi:hypothetical protein
MLASAASVLIVGTIAWGALSFGAVYPWAYWPLAIACVLAGGIGIAANRRRSAGASRAFVVALAGVGLTGLVQVVPLPIAVLQRISPAASGVLMRLHPGFAAGPHPTHTLSIDPTSTWNALVLYAAFAVLLLGTSRAMSLRSPGTLLRWLTVFGVVLALVGTVQKSVSAGKIYGFWTTRDGGAAFGPFVNKNHFAGWMLMAIPLALGSLAAGISNGRPGVRRDWRSQLLWFSSADASRLVLAAAGVAAMGLSLTMTLSRSGLCALMFALAIMGGCWLSTSSVARRYLIPAYMALVVVSVIAWAGADTIAGRFGATDWSNVNGRLGPLHDAWRTALAFPLTGTGLNTYGTAMLFFQSYNLQVHYSQAHNDYLQLAAEGGLLVCIPALMCVGLFIRDVVRRFREDDDSSSSYWYRVGAVAALVAIGLQETVEFSLQIPGNAALFAVVCGIAVHKAPSGRRRAGHAVPVLVRIASAGPRVASLVPRTRRENVTL